jgi:peptidoglycan/LPS O-acetylase OafA/YrhL
LDSALFNFLKNEILAVNVMIIIVNISSNTESVLQLENRGYDFLGKISYGLYVYHLIVAVGVIKGMMASTIYSAIPQWISGILTIVLTLIGSIIISYFSYRYFESYFLRKKEKFSVIKTG